MEQSGGGAGEMNSPLFAAPSLAGHSRKASLQQLCVEMRNKPSMWWDLG